MYKLKLQVNKNNSLDILKHIKKYFRKAKYIELEYEEIDDNIKTLIKVVKAYNMKDLSKRYLYIYDEVSQYLDQEFQEKNYCSFKENKCLFIREGNYRNSNCGCCYQPGKKVCKYLVDGHCGINSISCKLFTCSYLRKQGITFKIKDIPLLNIFFNLRQKYVLEYSLFTDKVIMIERLMKLR